MGNRENRFPSCFLNASHSIKYLKKGLRRVIIRLNYERVKLRVQKYFSL